MTIKKLLVTFVLFSAAILLGVIWFRSNSTKDQQIVDVLARIEALEQATQNLQIRSDSKPSDNTTDKSRTEEDIVGIDNLAKIAERLDDLELLLTELIESSSIKTQDVEDEPVNRNAPINQATEQHHERLKLLENTIEVLQGQFEAIFQSISPVVDLGSPEAELYRANRYYHELEEPSTAAHAYASLLDRYELSFNDTQNVLTNGTAAFDSACQARPSYLNDNLSVLLSFEDRVQTLQLEDQGNLFSRLANACMNGKSYEDAHRLYKKVIRVMPDGEDKVDAYWSMAFALRETTGERAFFDALGRGHKLGLDLGLNVSHFEKEIAEPREKK